MRKIIQSILVATLSLSGGIQAGPLEEFAELEQQMEAAQEKFAESSSAPDSRGEILARMDVLAETAEGPGGCEILVQTFRWSAGLDLDRKNLLKRFQRTALCGNHENIADALESVPEVFKRDGSVSDWVKTLELIKEGGKEPSIAASAALIQGRLLLAAGERSAAQKSFAFIIEKHAGTDSAKAAKGYLYEVENLQVGMTAPDFTAKMVDGKEISLSSLRGKVVLLDFWATWCGPCLAEIPHLKAAAEKFKDRPFVIVGISLDDMKEILESTIKQREVPGLQTWDDKGRENPVAEQYNIQDLPQTFLIGVDGKIQRRNTFGDALIPAIESAMPDVSLMTPRPKGNENP